MLLEKLQKLFQERIPILGAKGAMHEVADIRVRHGSFLSVVRYADFLLAWNPIPAMNRWAIFNRPLRGLALFGRILYGRLETGK